MDHIIANTFFSFAIHVYNNYVHFPLDGELGLRMVNDIAGRTDGQSETGIAAIQLLWEPISRPMHTV